MLDLLVATAALTALVGVLLVAGLALLVLPFVRAVDLAERRGASPAWAGAATLALSAAGLLLAFALRHEDVPTPLWLLPLALCWLVPAVLAVARGPLLGARGAHE